MVRRTVFFDSLLVHLACIVDDSSCLLGLTLLHTILNSSGNLLAVSLRLL